MQKKDRSQYSFGRKQSLNYLANLSSKETSWFGLCALVRALMTQEIMRSSDAQCNTK